MRTIIYGSFITMLLFSPVTGKLNADKVDKFSLSWRFITGGKIHSKPALDHKGIVYVASDDKMLYAILPSGKEKWRFQLGGKPSASPVIGYDGTIYIGTESGKFFAVAPNRRLRWSFSTNSGACLNPALGNDGTIYLPTRSGTLFALNFRGKEKWRYQIKAEISSSPSIGPEGTIYIGSVDRRLLALEPCGRKKWEVEMSGRVGTPAVGSDGTLFVNGFGIQSVSPEGAVLWNYSIPAQTADPVISPDGAIIAGAQNARLYAISPQGKKLWDLFLGGVIQDAAAVAGDNTIYVGAEDNRLHAVSCSGEAGGSFSAKKAVNIPSIGPDGAIYFGSDDWILYALKGRVEGPAGSPWPIYLHDTQHTGRFTGLKDLAGPSAIILKEMAYSDSIELKYAALKDIERYIRGEKFLAVHIQTLEEVLGFLVAEGVTHSLYHYRKVMNNHPLVRIKSCEVLGYLATEGAQDILLEVIRRDQDGDVKTAAMEAMGKIGIDPDGEAVKTIAIELERGRLKEKAVLTAIDALGSIIENANRFADPSAYLVLARVAHSNYSQRVKLHAAGVLAEVSKREEMKRRSVQ